MKLAERDRTQATIIAYDAGLVTPGHRRTILAWYDDTSAGLLPRTNSQQHPVGAELLGRASRKACPAQNQIVFRLFYRLLAGLASLTVRSGRSKDLEIIVLRHQLAVLGRTTKPVLTESDRSLLAMIATPMRTLRTTKKQETRTPIRVRALPMSRDITLVAGTGFEPVTFGL